MSEWRNVRVRFDTWKRLKLESVESGQTLAAYLEAKLAMPLPVPAKVTGLREKTTTSVPARPVKAPSGPSPEPTPDDFDHERKLPKDEDRCTCGQRWMDHQAGDSGRLAIRTNCRQFRVSA